MTEFSYADTRQLERLYGHSPDPSRFTTSEHEREKYAATLDALPPGRYERALEIGCSIGVLTRRLAASCETLLGIDISPAALQQAESRCDDMPWVQFAAMDIRTEWPDGSFDLILFSEVLYQLGEDGIEAAATKSLATLSPNGTVMLVNWLGPTGTDCSGDEAAERFIAACRSRLTPMHQRRTQHYRLDTLK